MSLHIPEGEVPDEIRVVNEFLNTLDLSRVGEHANKREEERDELRNVDGLRTWLAERDLIGADEPVTEADRRLAVDVRAALRAAAGGNSPRRAFAGEPVEFADLPLKLRIGADGRPVLESGRGVKGALGRILADVAVSVSTGAWDRMKVCDAEDCRWAYYDHSKSRTGRWCAMETCGNRHKTRRYRAAARRRQGSDAREA